MSALDNHDAELRIALKVAWQMWKHAGALEREERRKFLRLIHEMIESGWRQAEIARELGVTRQAIQTFMRWKEGQR